MREQKVERRNIAAYLRDLAAAGSPFATVSGVLTTRADMIREVDRRVPQIGVITTKSYEVEANPGNPEPVLVEDGIGSFGNAVGLRNPGMKKGLEDLKKLKSSYSMRSLLNVSLSGKSPEEFVRLAEAFSEAADILELNFSCPHAAAGYGMSIGSDPETVARYVAAVRAVTDRPIFPKLTPNVEDIGAIAEAAIAAGADGIVAINTVGPDRFVEPHSGQDVLMNARGNRGGRSGRGIKNIAEEKIRQIRAVLGPEIPIIGMGGVENGEDAEALRRAGADSIGLGSLWARIHPSQWPAFFDALETDMRQGSKLATDFLLEERRMEYRPHRITASYERPGGVRVIELTGEVEYEASQFVFLWLPGIGEKPFSVAGNHPLTFIIKDRGRVSAAVCALEAGETVYLRGVYGHAPPECDSESALVIAGGTGVAVAPRLVEELTAKNKAVSVYVGISRRGSETLEKEISRYAHCTVVPDDGEPARVLKHLVEEESGTFARRSIYVVGPANFMNRALRCFMEFGGRPERAFASVETPTRCGIGICGECSCGGHLTCRQGTFVSAAFLEENGIDIEEISASKADLAYTRPPQPVV